MKRGKHAVAPSKRAKVTIIGADEDGMSVVSSKVYGPLAAEARSTALRRENERSAESTGTSLNVDDPAADGGGGDSPVGRLWDSSGPPSPASSTSTASHDVSGELHDAFVEHRQPINTRQVPLATWGLRRARAVQTWSAQLQELIDAYLELKHTSTTAGAPPPTAFPQYSTDAHVLESPIRGTVQLVDLSAVYLLPRAELGAGHANVALLGLGYLGSSPTRPTIAFSVRTLLLFERLRARARTGKMNFVRAFCDILNIPYITSVRNRFADAVDALGRILRGVEERVRIQLHRDKVWRVKNGCPACSYKCDGEGALVFARQLTMDGNNSLKRFLGPGSVFEVPFESEYLLGRDYTDQFKDEVQTQRQRAGKAPDPNAPADDAAAGLEETECSSRWRNARPESEKTAQWDALDETGVFLCACRHGFIVAAVDMWQSGELAKYPLAIVYYLLEVLGDDGLLQLGYDIGCVNSGTAGRSSFGERVKALVRYVVGSFHGHAHNRPCQLGFHPRYIEGSGREDFETCERIFSVTNLIAPLIRHATPYHRHEDMDVAFATSDSEKYASIGSLLLSKFKDAKTKIAEHESAMLRIRNNPRYTDEFFHAQLADERSYLLGTNTVTAATVQEELAHEYLIILDLFEKAKSSLAALGMPIATYRAPGDADKANRKWLAAKRRVREREEQLEALEERMDVDERWTKTTPAYIDAMQYKARRAYAKVLDELERAVVSRLLELEKLNMRSTGYKLRRHIAKALNRRGATLVNILQRYNKAAKALTPPRATLTREQVLDIAFIADFSILRQDVGTQEWAQPAIRQLTTAWAETARANEELQRIRIEAVRVRTWIRDEEDNLNTHITTLSAGNTLQARLLVKELDARAQILHGVHTRILTDLDALDVTDGLKKPRKAGRRAGDPEGRQYAPRQPVRIPLPPLVVTRGPAQAGQQEEGELSDEEDDVGRHTGLNDNDAEELDAFLQAVDAIAR
ncbi:hypothetical protein EXIGLDRAFT_843038 [Exidia glandulosa HHB12029]|uniref:CxC1-like cysteine cluster associated with KDZ transposases domain-containing protein n=1 Tax=Exidia glandulosa HHB12029 TaxID=1314781 RepID=A0A165CWZ8_EXIGL|nr:hypothetical protein EXIGLDRAFT_843038 [Exidia glandulosa HHB12029]